MRARILLHVKRIERVTFSHVTPHVNTIARLRVRFHIPLCLCNPNLLRIWKMLAAHFENRARSKYYTCIFFLNDNFALLYFMRAIYHISLYIILGNFERVEYIKMSNVTLRLHFTSWLCIFVIWRKVTHRPKRLHPISITRQPHLALNV